MDPFERARAKLFDRVAEQYDRCRPPYPDALIDEVLGPAPRGLSVLDVASGTGIASRAMAQRGAEVLGVELNPRMAAVAERHGIRTEVSAFESWDAAGRTFDRVTCAQAWHWLDAVVSTDKALSVLRPGGRLCLFWSIGHHPDDLAEALAAAYARGLPPESRDLVIGYATNGSRDRSPDFGSLLDALGARRELSAPEMKSFPWTRTYSRAAWLDELLSHSDHAALADDARRSLFDEIGETIDRFGGTFDMSYRSILVSAHKHV